MSKTPNYDAAVKKILDATEPGERICVLTGEKWLMDEEELAWYRRFNVPPSKYSPTSRMIYLLSFFTGYQWWYNKHAETGAPVITAVHPATGYKVLPDKEWFAKDFQVINTEIKPDQNFFEQLYSLSLKIPLNASRNYVEPENSVALASLGDINSYFVLACQSKNTLFSISARKTEDSCEIFNCDAVSRSYQIVHSQRIHNCRYVMESADCVNSYFLFDCRNCENCFGATNQRNKKYLWFNEQLNREEYEGRLSEVDFGSRQQMQEHTKRFEMFLKEKSIWPENFNEKTENCIGEYLNGCHDCKYSFSISKPSQNMYWTAFNSGGEENVVFTCGGYGSHDVYYNAAVGGSFNTLFSLFSSRLQSCEFCVSCYDSEFCFGCVGLNKKKYCILNQQYTEEEYWKKVDEIKTKMLVRGEYGEFLPGKFSSSYYSESGATIYYLSDDEFGKKMGAHFFDPESEGAIGRELSDSTTIKDASLVPDNIKDLEVEAWAKIPLYDAVYDRRFAFLKPELEFYKQEGIAPPNNHFMPRVRSLLWHANSSVIEKQNCTKCQKEILVAINKTFKNRKIYCHACYLKHLEENN
jgi:hypothetical protein